MRLDTTPPDGAGKSQGTTKTERLLQIIEGLGHGKTNFLPIGIRTAELADRAEVPRGSVQALLAPYVASGRLQCCKVTVPGSPGPEQSEYRAGGGVALPEFQPLNTRRGPGSAIVARNGVATRAATPLSSPRQTPADITTPTLIQPQPAVGITTPAAGDPVPPRGEPAVAAQATPKPQAHAPLKKEPAARKASAGDDLDITLDDKGTLTIATCEGVLELSPKHAKRLGHFMTGSQGIWNPL